MSNKVDIAELKKNTDITEVIGRHVYLKKDGPHWIAPCPFHKDNTASFKVTPAKNIWKCFGCGKGGDVFDFLVQLGRTMPEAIQEINDPNNTAGIPLGDYQKQESFKKEAPESVWKQIIPGIRTEEMHVHYKHGKPSMVWEYVNPSGELLGCICRFDLPEGKEVLPLIYAIKGEMTVPKWVFKGFEKPRPLFNWDKIVANSTAIVLVVEGEKTAKAAEILFPNTVVTTWIGGVMGVKHANWSVLKGRTVILWPDNDEPGFNAMHDVYSQLKTISESVKWVFNPSGAEKGWDLADAEWTPEEAKVYSSTNIINYPGRDFKYEGKSAQNEITWTIGALEKTPSPKEAKVISIKSKAEKKQNSSPPISEPPTDKNGFTIIGSNFFRILGSQKEGNGMIYYFYAFGTKTVIGLSPSAMTKNNLMQLAPLNWWKNSFEDSKNAFSVDHAANYLISCSSNVGTFSEKWLRGRGAWMDEKRVVLHTGDKLFINGVETPLSEYKSKYIYEIGEELGFSIANPIGNTSAKKLIELLTLLNWDRAINPYLLAGWCVVAPICGALNWRPHIWLTGAAGTGKTWVFKKIVRELLGETGLAVQGETSEAGLRQTLGHDALPVVFDEAEGEDRRAQDRMQAVLSLMRASSAQDGGIMAKGSAGGSAKTYRIRSCFAFASIGVQVAQQSDRSRVTILGLVKATDETAGKRWLEFQAKYDALVTEEFCRGIRARTVSILPTIISNIKTFSNATAAVIGEQRAGDQIGVLLAGAYSLVSDKVITYKEAVEWVASKDWEEEKSMGATSDENALMSFLLEQHIRVETKHSTVVRTVGEMVLTAMLLRLAEWDISPEQANDLLKRVGIKVKDGFLFISNSDLNIQKMLVGTAWSKNHHKILLRIESAVQVQSERFASGVSTRAVKISRDSLFKGYVPEIVPQPMTPLEAANEISKPSSDPFKEDLPF